MGINYFAIENALLQACLRGERRFNAYTLSYWADEKNVIEVNEYLLTKNGSVLDARIEFLCSQYNHPTNSISFGDDIPLTARCHVCSDEFVPNLEESNIVYYFTDTTKQSCEEMKKKTAILVPI